MKTASGKIKVLFEFMGTIDAKPMLYRAVLGADGAPRLERRGLAAKTFSVVYWGGGEKGFVAAYYIYTRPRKNGWYWKPPIQPVPAWIVERPQFIPDWVLRK